MDIAIMQTRNLIHTQDVSSRDNINPEFINARTSDFKAQPSRYPEVVFSLFGWLSFCSFAPTTRLHKSQPGIGKPREDSGR